MSRTSFSIGSRKIGAEAGTYFIADIAANHDGSLERAKKLISLAAESGADAAKFQHFEARTIVSDIGFKSLTQKLSHQSKWSKSVFQVYQDASLPPDWAEKLKSHCDSCSIEFMSTPYSRELAEVILPLVNAFKIGSGDITDLEFLDFIAKKGKPVILATGASSMQEVEAAAGTILKSNSSLALLQCNTNYTASKDNFTHLNLKVLVTFASHFPGLPLGISDHTLGHSSALGAVALGACIIEKHFTDDTSRPGPDHPFSMTPTAWRSMIEAVHELEDALGDGVKRVEDNELETVVVQRRSIRAAKDLPEGSELARNDLTCLRPCPHDAIPPFKLSSIVGRTLRQAVASGQHITEDMLS